MKKYLIGVFVVGVLGALSGCGTGTTASLLKKDQPVALQAAVDRATFDSGCLHPTGTVMSSEMIKPPIGGGNWVGAGQEAKYTVNVSGCEKTTTYTVRCPIEGAGCTATDVNQPTPTP